MKLHFLFPASPLNMRMIDEMFQEQAIALKLAGFGTSAISLEEDRLTPNVTLAGATVVYRGWMLKEREYDHLLELIAMYGGVPSTTKEQYLLTHHLPNWYPLIAPLTPETIVFPKEEIAWLDRIVPICQQMGWEKYQLKDYVKSLKTAGGSVATNPMEIMAILDNMDKYRDGIEGGVVMRRWEEFAPDSEKRYFVLNEKYYSPEGPTFEMRVMDLLKRVKNAVASPFFSVDIAKTPDGHFRVVELGDGQVSDLVGWTPERFAEIWK